MCLLLVACLGLLPKHEHPHLDVFEVNYLYDMSTGNRRFVQCIIWQRYPGVCLHVTDWGMHQEWSPKIVYRPADGSRDRYRVAIVHEGQVRVFSVDRLKVSHTFVDPEAEDRDALPTTSRRSVLKPASK